MTALEIKGFIPNTMLDWEGMLATTIFLPRCNFRCPFCQNPDLVLHPERLQTVPFGEFADFILERKGWIDGVCVTGGEPCLHADLPQFCASLKDLGLEVKLDTNGSLPEMLERLLAGKLVDYVAMDLKAPLEAAAYRVATGTGQADLVESVNRSVELLGRFGVEREFRTTVVPMLHGPTEVGQIAQALAEAGEERYYIQRFSPRSTLDPRYSGLRPFADDDIEQMLKSARRFLKGTSVRGAPAGIDQE